MLAYDKPLTPHQFAVELTAAGVAHNGIGTAAGEVFTFTQDGRPKALPAAAGAVLDVHVARREVTDDELREEFRNPLTTSTRKQQIRDMLSGLAERETVLA